LAGSDEVNDEPVRPGEGLRIDPIRVDGRRRSAAPSVAIVALAAFVALALVKPWEPGPRPAPSASEPHLSAAALRSSTPIPSPAAPARRTLADASHWAPLIANPDRLAGQPLVSDRDLGGTSGDGTCGGSAGITPFDELIGIADPAGERITGVRLVPIDTISRADVAVRIAPNVTKGLTLVALPSGGIAARQYALIAETKDHPAPGALIYTICVG
jgi:hypothetical protein